ncbi:MAG: hypothetical protein R2857_03880 [Vampirovibrionales bacterium]
MIVEDDGEGETNQNTPNALECTDLNNNGICDTQETNGSAAPVRPLFLQNTLHLHAPLPPLSVGTSGWLAYAGSCIIRP